MGDVVNFNDGVVNPFKNKLISSFDVSDEEVVADVSNQVLECMQELRFLEDYEALAAYVLDYAASVLNIDPVVLAKDVLSNLEKLNK